MTIPQDVIQIAEQFNSLQLIEAFSYSMYIEIDTALRERIAAGIIKTEEELDDVFNMLTTSYLQKLETIFDSEDSAIGTFINGGRQQLLDLLDTDK